ncbi:hypothetical protein PHSY_002400 [Pseudozyma hubeiensis SY62]|uniref:DUF202 domain-containing protein n=1 Tax=Pseudozyma hubeiensis (strain SY62) TaxID=1305764 RepID=R9P170_PSEHS|nr:hypothetical protein PHSY_002400 [Pseudozyma hubeiensis SY62]GAC94827.1 hypothetical protein PHSY_002400 [Pseudozyma hubeiensis SY62]
MPGESSSQPGTGLKGIKRINTGLSEASGDRPRSSASACGRLSLHIPNAYPRAHSPRSPGSKDVTPETSRAPSPSASGAGQHRRPPTASSSFSALKGPQLEEQVEPPSDGSVRASSLASNTQSFRKESSLIAVGDIEDSDGHPAGDSALNSQTIATDPSHDAGIHLRNTTLGRLLSPFSAARHFFDTHETSSASARDFLARERNFFSWLKLSCLLAILSASLILQLQLPDKASIADHRPRDPPRRRSDHGPVDWDDIPVSSKAFAAIFFILSLLSLGTGLADYLSAERQLEKEHVDFDETEGVFLNDGHTSNIVHGVMLAIGGGIVASGFWLLTY